LISVAVDASVQMVPTPGAVHKSHGAQIRATGWVAGKVGGIDTGFVWLQ
jgi:hypothetical protein